MAKKTRSVILAEYIFARVFMAFSAVLPWTAARFTGRVLGSLCGFCMRGRTRILKANLKNAFPDKSGREIDGIARRVWENIGMTLMEFLKIPFIDSGNIGRFVKFKGTDNVKKAAAKDKGIIFFGAHYFNWEIINIVLGSMGYQVASVAKPFDNPKINSLVTGIRGRFGGKIIFHRQAIKEGLRQLKQKKCLGLLIDQHYGASDIECDFFGRSARTSPIISAFVNKADCPVVPIRCLREGGVLVVEAFPEVKLPAAGSLKQFYAESTQIFTSIIEDWVRQKPEGWFWVHRRWR